jgi:hypothetical protein
MPVHHRLRFLTFPMRASRLCGLWPDMRPLRFRRAPFGRDGTFDLGGATASRIMMPHMLPSTVPSVSTSAKFFLFVAQSPTPSDHCALRTRRRRRLRNTRFPAARCRLTGAAGEDATWAGSAGDYRRAVSRRAPSNVRWRVNAVYRRATSPRLVVGAPGRTDTHCGH